MGTDRTAEMLHEGRAAEPESSTVARPGSTVAPTIVFRGTGAARRPILALGAAGNAWITSAVYQTLVGVLDQGLSPQAALEQPRFLVGGRGFGAGGARETNVQIE